MTFKMSPRWKLSDKIEDPIPIPIYIGEIGNGIGNLSFIGELSFRAHFKGNFM